MNGAVSQRLLPDDSGADPHTTYELVSTFAASIDDCFVFLRERDRIDGYRRKERLGVRSLPLGERSVRIRGSAGGEPPFHLQSNLLITMSICHQTPIAITS